MAYKVTISDGTILEKSIETVTFNANPPPDNYYCMRTYTISSMQITGRIGAGEKTISLYEWSLLPTNNPNCYKEIVVEQTHAGQTVRIVKFSEAFVVDYSESYSKGEGFGHFSIFIRQLAGVDIEITNEITPQSTMTELSNEVEELSSPLVQSAGIAATSSIAKKSRPNFTDILAKKREDSKLNEMVKTPSEIANSSPIKIPSSAKVVKQTKNGYNQIKYTWSDGTYKYEARWHTRTPGAPEGQGNTWVVTRTTPGNITGQQKVQHIMTGENKWTPMKQWQDAVTTRQNGTATLEQQKLLDSGHWPAS